MILKQNNFMKKIQFTTHGEVAIDGISPSKTNPRRPEDFKGAAFDDLVASVKEKGVLMPILVRPTGVATYELVAGERRFRAAVVAGLKTIPAQIKAMNDEEAREAQIVENLQRADIHPIEEGMAYRKLLEESNKPPNSGAHSVKSIAAKVGKSEPYVRQRLFLTNLLPAAAEAYRSGKIHDGHAVAIARLTPKAQAATWKWLDDEMRYDNVPDVKDLREHIRKDEFQRLRVAPPWKGTEIPEAACTECQKSGKETLFGKDATEQCADPACYARKMAVWCAMKEKEYKDSGKPLTLVSSQYGHEKGQKLLRKSDYHVIEGKKDNCDTAHDALVVEGEEDLGKILSICTDKKCKKHTKEYAPYAPSPKELEKRRAEKKKQEAREAAKTKKEIAENEKLAKKLLTAHPSDHATVMLELALLNASENAVRNLSKEKGWEVKRTKRWNGDKTAGMVDYTKTVRTAAMILEPAERKVLALALLLSTAQSWAGARKKIVKLL